MTELFANVVALPSSGRDATTAFIGGTGDVLLAYENEAILARQNGEEFDYVIPDTTILIENPGAVLNDADPEGQDWLDFVLSADGQRQFALKGFRPIDRRRRVRARSRAPTDPADPFPAVTNLLTVAEDFGSWAELSDKFFDEEAGIVTQDHRRLRQGRVTGRRRRGPSARAAPVGPGRTGSRARRASGSASRCSGSACSC